MEYRYRAQGEVFEADATYMQSVYGLRPFDSDVTVHYEIEEARRLLGIKEDDPWGENPGEWCDIITTRGGKLLAIAADGELGHPGTNYRVREIEAAMKKEEAVTKIADALDIEREDAAGLLAKYVAKISSDWRTFIAERLTFIAELRAAQGGGGKVMVEVTCQCPCARCCNNADADSVDYRNEPVCSDCKTQCSY